MRKLILQMMTTLNGRLDSPFEWVTGVGDAHYRAIEAAYRTFDTVLVGRATYDEMVNYWPAALASGEGSESNRRMAQHMHDHRKLVFSRSGSRDLTHWNNAEQVVASDNQALVDYIAALKAQPGRDIHLSGGGRFAQAVIGLDLVDRYQLSIYPTVSLGTTWMGALEEKHDLILKSSAQYENGVLALTYERRNTVDMGSPQRFTELIN